MISERYTRAIGSVAFTVYSMTGACVALVAWYYSRFPLEVPELAHATWPDMAALVVIGTVAGVFVTAEGVRRVGAQRSAIVSTTGPPAAALLGWLFLGETMHAPQWIGMAPDRRWNPGAGPDAPARTARGVAVPGLRPFDINSVIGAITLLMSKGRKPGT